MPSPGCSISFEPSYGVQHIATTADVITSISEPNWERFLRSLEHLHMAGFEGNFILSPELITIADLDVERVAEQRDVIEARAEAARALTADYPASTLLLGTVAFDTTPGQPHNAVVHLRHGVEVGRTYKLKSTSRREERLLPLATNVRAPQKPAANILNLICYDFVEPPAVDAAVDTVLVNACWAVPSDYEGVTPGVDRRVAEETMGILAEGWFTSYPHVETIVMTDRVPPGSWATAPFNFVARRTDK